MGKQRATTATERTARRRLILSATENLLESWSLDDVNVDRIADLAGVAKGTVYRYYRTRGELILEVFDSHHGLWCNALATQIDGSAFEPTPDDIGGMVVAGLAGDPLLVRLFGRIGSLLRGSVSPQAARLFQAHRAARITRVATALERRISNVTALKAERWMLRIEFVIAGMASLAHSPSARATAVELSDTLFPDLGLESELRHITATTLSLP